MLSRPLLWAVDFDRFFVLGERSGNMLRFYPRGISQQATRAKTTLAVFPIPWGRRQLTKKKPAF